MAQTPAGAFIDGTRWKRGAIAGAAGLIAIAGFVIVKGGYNAAFFSLAGIALAALMLFLFFMPETMPKGELRAGKPATYSTGSRSCLRFESRSIRRLAGHI